MDVLLYPSPLGTLVLEANQDHLRRISFSQHTAPSELLLPRKSAIFNKFVHDLEQYFQNKQPIPIDVTIPQGTLFQQQVWRTLLTLQFGETITYGALAKRLSTSARAVGNACRSNPLPIVIPCHRVIGQRCLGGYAGFTQGDTFNIKTWLLKHEGVLGAC